MIRFLFLVVVLFAIVFGFAWLREMPGELALTIGGNTYAVDLAVAALAALAAIVAALVLFLVLSFVLRAPARAVRGWRRGREERGRHALADGFLAL
ncbi:heme biosynthesis HemY N-terminal domain-containing protein, partial [Propylenella binzhouense]